MGTTSLAHPRWGSRLTREQRVEGEKGWGLEMLAGWPGIAPGWSRAGEHSSKGPLASRRGAHPVPVGPKARFGQRLEEGPGAGDCCVSRMRTSQGLGQGSSAPSRGGHLRTSAGQWGHGASLSIHLPPGQGLSSSSGPPHLEGREVGLQPNAAPRVPLCPLLTSGSCASTRPPAPVWQGTRGARGPPRC